MPGSTKEDIDKSKIDKIEPIEKLAEESDEGTSVISVKLSKDDKDKTEVDKPLKKGKKSDDTKKTKETVTKPKEVKDVDELSDSKTEIDNPPDVAAKQVSSFSQLDSEKVLAEEDKTKEETPPEILEPKELGKSDKATKSQEELTQDVKKWLEDIHPEARPEDAGGSHFSFKSIILIIFLLGVLALIVGGFYFYQTSQESATEISVEPTPSTESTPTPTPTPEAEIDLSTYSVQVLNGTGVAGQAGSAATDLESAGFVDVQAANANSSSYKETSVAMKEGVANTVFVAIQESLDPRIVVIADEVLTEEEDFDVVITLGTSEKEPETEEE